MWEYFNYPNLLREAKLRLAEARADPEKLTPEKDTIEYWCAWTAHANAVAVIKTEPGLIERLREG